MGVYTNNILGKTETEQTMASSDSSKQGLTVVMIMHMDAFQNHKIIGMMQETIPNKQLLAMQQAKFSS